MSIARKTTDSNYHDGTIPEDRTARAWYVTTTGKVRKVWEEEYNFFIYDLSPGKAYEIASAKERPEEPDWESSKVGIADNEGKIRITSWNLGFEVLS